MITPDPDVEAVLAANQAFYDAFEAGDLDTMSDLWEHSDRTSCVHPGWRRLEGWALVGASWAALFQGPPRMQFIITGVRAEVVGDLAFVSLDENILGEQPGATAAALNIFARHGDRWRVVAHHSAAVVATTP